MLTALYPPFIGGIEQHVRNLARALVERGHTVSIATMAGPESPAYEADDGVRVHRLTSSAHRFPALGSPQGRPHSPPFPDPEVTVRLSRLVRAEQPDVVHAHDWMVRSFLPLKRRNGPRLVLTLHNYGVTCAKLDYMYRGAVCSGPGFSKCLRCAASNYGTLRGAIFALGNWTLQPAERALVDMFIPVSTAVATGNELAHHGLPFQVVPNFVPDDVAERATADPSALRMIPAGPFWLYVGALSRNKGIHVLLDAYARLSNAAPLVIIGPRWHDTPESFPAGTHVIEGVPQATVMAAWRRASIGIVPSTFPDPCPTVAMEAMACGVPLIASRVGGLTDLVDDGKTGVLVTPGDSAALGEAVWRLHTDSQRRARMREAALEKVRSFMSASVVSRVERIYAAMGV
jgi:glycosyltransferase involved in cell wall biosynthesis